MAVDENSVSNGSSRAAACDELSTQRDTVSAKKGDPQAPMAQRHHLLGRGLAQRLAAGRPPGEHRPQLICTADRVPVGQHDGGAGKRGAGPEQGKAMGAGGSDPTRLESPCSAHPGCRCRRRAGEPGEGARVRGAWRGEPAPKPTAAMVRPGPIFSRVPMAQPPPLQSEESSQPRPYDDLFLSLLSGT